MRSQPGGQLPPLHLIDLGGEVREALAVVGKQRFPVAPRLAAALADAVGEVLHDSVGHQELGILRPVIGALDELHLVFAQGLAMGRGGIDLVRRAIADVAVENDQRRPAFGLAEDRERILDALEIVGIADPQHIPMIGEEARGDVLGEGDAGLAFDGDVIVVVDPAQIVEGEMAGERGRLRADAFHQAAVAANGIDVVVEEIEAGLVVAAGQAISARWPCRRWWRCPDRADRSSPRRRRPNDIPDAPAPCCRAGGNGGCRRA